MAYRLSGLGGYLLTRRLDRHQQLARKPLEAGGLGYIELSGLLTLVDESCWSLQALQSM